MRFCEVEGCEYPVFSTDKITRKGYCRTHAPRMRTDIDRRSIIQRAIAKQKGISSKVRTLKDLPENVSMVDKIKGSITQENWYLKQRNKMTGKCSNCGGNTTKNNDKYFKWAIAHVFPKKIFDSVSKNDNNWIELCLRCHTLFDRNLATASEMKCFKLAVIQYQKFRDEVTEIHKFKTLFEEYINQL